MRELLGEKDNRRLNIIEEISLTPGISLEYLCRQFYLTENQIQIDLDFLIRFILPLKIEITKDKKLYLHIPQHLSPKIIYQRFLENNINFKLLELILYKEYRHYEDLANDLFVSLATLKRVIRFINESFEPYGMSIKSRPLRITGNESNIRAFYLFYLQERYLDDIYPFSSKITTYSKELVTLFIDKFPDDTFNYASKMRMMRYISVSLLRETMKHNIVHTDIPKELEKIVEYELEIYQNRKSFESTFKMNLTPQLYQRLFFQYINSRHAFSQRDYNDRISKIPENHEIYEGLKTTIQEISHEFNLELKDFDKLLLRLYNTISLGKNITITPYIIYPNRKIFLLFNQALHGNIVKQFRKIFAVNLPMIDQKNKNIFYEFLYLLVTHWPNFYKMILCKAFPCKIGLFFNSDIEHMYYMKEHLSFLYGDKVNINLIDTDTLDTLNDKIKDLDLLIINFILPKKLSLEIPHICIVDGFSEEENKKIKHLIDNIYYGYLYDKPLNL